MHIRRTASSVKVKRRTAAAKRGSAAAGAVGRYAIPLVLITVLLDWARKHPTLEKVQLGVFAENARAVALYRSLGFVQEGHRRRGFKHPDGTYSDDILMATFVKPLSS